MITPTLQGELQGLARDLRRRRRFRLFVRAGWLALLWFGVGLIAQVLHHQLPWRLLGGAALLTFIVGVLYSWGGNPKLGELARGYDQHFGLQEQLASALETATAAPASTIAERLIEQALITIRQYRTAIHALPRTPWREVETLVAIALMLIALALTTGNHGLPEQQPVAFPLLATPPPASEPTPTNEAATAEASSAAKDQAAADALAHALDGTNATRPAADALRQGNNEGAAQSLRDQANQGNSLSQADRSTLGNDLHAAANELKSAQNQRAAQIEQSAQELATNRQQGLQDLAHVLEQLGKGNPPNSAQAQATTGAGDQGGGLGGTLGGTGKQLGGEHRTGPSNPPQAAGAALPLPTPATASGPATSATGAHGPTIQLQAGGTGSRRASGGGGGSNDPLPGEADPLRIPPEDRDAVENYFSPAP